MKSNILFIVSLAIFPLTGYGQTSSIVNDTLVDKMPSFPEGTKEMYRYIYNNLHYPVAAKIKKITGEVFVQFIVGIEGEIRDIKVTRSLGYGCDEEAIRVVDSMNNGHRWNPGMHKGHPVPVTFTLSIKFVPY